MTNFDLKRRFVLKGIGVVGATGVLVACGGGNGSGSGSGSGDPDNPSNGGGVVPNPPTPRPTPAASCSNPGYTIPLYIDASFASTGIPENIPVYAYVTGDLASVYYYYDPVQKKPVLVNPNTDNTQPAGPQLGLSGAAAAQNYPNTWADRAIQLERNCTSVVLDFATFNPTNIPGLTDVNCLSARVWISVGTPKIPFQSVFDVNGRPAITQPNIATTSGVGSYCLADFMEFSIGSTPNFNCDVSQVNGVGIPMTLQITGSNIVSNAPGNVDYVGQYIYPRTTLLSKFAASTNPLFSSLPSIPTDPTQVAAGTYPPPQITGGYFGVTAPYMTPNAQSSVYLDNVVTQAWSNWANNPVTVSNVMPVANPPTPTTWYGRANGNMLYFYSSWPAANVDTSTAAFAFDRNNVTTYSILAGNGELNKADVPGQQQVGENLLAAFNRGIATTQTVFNNLPGQYAPAASTFYKTPQYNHYAYRMHQYSSNNLAYAFSYDDTMDQNPTLSATQITSMTIQISSFV